MNFLNKSDFIRAMADKNGYSLTDNGMMLDTLAQVIEECIRTKTEIDVRGLFHLRFKKVTGGYHRFSRDGELKLYPDGMKLVFSLAKNLKQLAKEVFSNEKEKETEGEIELVNF